MTNAFGLVRTIEVDLRLGDDTATITTIRVEFFRAEGDATRFRCRLWRLETYRIKPTFPQENGLPKHEESDEEILVDWTTFLKEDLIDFKAQDLESAERKVLDGLRSRAAEAGKRG